MASLSNSPTAFYATAATVIPVLLVASALQLAWLARQPGPLGKRIADREGRFWRAMPYRIAASVITTIVIAGILFPLIGEASAFVALARNHSTRGEILGVTVGLIVSAVLAVGPTLVTLLLGVWRYATEINP